MKQRTAKDVLDELVAKADTIHVLDMDRRHPGGSKIGQLISELSEEDKKLLSALSSDDLAPMRPFTGYHPRPQSLSSRQRDRAAPIVKKSPHE